MSKLKLMTIIGTRPEIIRLSATIKRCDQYFDQVLVHTGQNYDYSLNQVFFEDLGLREPDYYLNAVGKDLGETIGNIIAKSYQLMAEMRPDAVLVLGDTNSCLSVIGAKRLHIPIFHMEAGNRCFDECLPEETNRRIVDVTADVNLCYSEHARRYLNAAGTPKERTYVVGSPMAEVLHNNLEQIKRSDILEKLKLEKGKYILLSAHREENIDTEKNFFNLMNAVNEMAKKYNLKTFSDLAHYPDLFTFGAEYDFYEINDGYADLCAYYNLKFKKNLDMDIGLKYEAMRSGKIDVINIFTTDGQLSHANLTILKDDKHFFPSYYCATIVREETLKEHPELERILEKMNGILTDQEMADMNYKVDVEHRTEREVAVEFLKKKGLLNPQLSYGK